MVKPTTDMTATVQRLQAELARERAERLKAMQRVAGLQSGNRRLRVLVLDARAKLAKAQLRTEPAAKAKGTEGHRASP
jgi:hypothetical protein